jgi:hypothetical protein
MLVAQLIASHNAAMECYARAMRPTTRLDRTAGQCRRGAS